MHCSDYPKRVILAWRLKNVMMKCITDWTQVVVMWSWIEQHIHAPSSPSPSSLLWQTRLNSSSMSDSLPSLRQDVLAWSCLSILWCFRSNYYVAALTYEHNRRCPPCLIVCIGYSAESHGQTISPSITCQWHGGVPWDPQDSRPCTTRSHLSCVPIREAKQLHREFHLNAWIRFSVYLPPVFMPRTNIAFVGSTRYLNILNLIWKPMLLSFTITAVAVAILM